MEKANQKVSITCEMLTIPKANIGNSETRKSVGNKNLPAALSSIQISDENLVGEVYLIPRELRVKRGAQTRAKISGAAKNENWQTSIDQETTDMSDKFFSKRIFSNQHP